MISLRIGLLGASCVAVSMAAGVACSSSSNPVGSSGSSSGGSSGSSSGGSSGGVDLGDGGIRVGDGGACPTPTGPLAVGTEITVNVSWPATAGVLVAKPEDGKKYYLDVLTTYTVDPTTNKITGTTKPCGNRIPDIALNVAGSMAVGDPQGMGALVQNKFPASDFTVQPPTSTNGIQGGWTIGSSFEIDSSVSLTGLLMTSKLADPTTPWPADIMHINPSDLAYADGGAYTVGTSPGQPGVAAVFTNTPPYYLGTTSLDSTSPKVVTAWIVSRTAFGLYGTRTSCTETQGEASVTLINSRAAGCDLANNGGPCNADQYGFLDSNVTQYTPHTAIFDSKQLTGTMDCSDVLATFPLPP